MTGEAKRSPRDEEPEWPGVVTIRRGSQGELPLFCVHAEAGDVSLYYNLAAHLKGVHPVLGLPAPAVSGRGPGSGLRGLAEHHVARITELQPDGPYLILGECTGGALAYEIALQLREAGQPIGLLALIDAFSPGLPRLRPFMPKTLYRLIHRARILAFHFRNVRGLDGSRKLSYVGSRAARLLGKLKARAMPGTERSGPSADAEFRAALADYSPAGYEGPLVLFRAAELPLGIEHAPDMGWGSLARKVEVVTVPGYFTTPISEPGVRVLADRLSGHLAGIMTPGG